jgi:DNA repair exonuclease SbcCD ATPase subunit
MSRIHELRTAYERQRGRQQEILSTIDALRREGLELKKLKRRTEEAREIIRFVAQKTQEQLSYHISDITSLAMEAVFPNPYSLVVEFVQRRNRTECDLLFERDGLRIDPLSASGVGAIDVASFALRIASWSMAVKRTRPVIILDEPFRYLSENYQPLASAMLKEVSQKLGIQFIIVTHEMVLAEHADKVFQVSIKKGVSKVTEL